MNPATDWVDGRLGTALDFDGGDDYVKDTDIAIGGLTAITVSGWVKADNITSNEPSHISGGNAVVSETGIEDNSLALLLGDNDAVYLYLDTGGAGCATSKKVTSVVSENKWHHVVGAWDKDSSDVRIYVDGKQVGSASFDPGCGGLNNVSVPFRIGAGADNNGNVNKLFDGQIDNVRIYDRALTKANVHDLYQSGFAKVNTSRKLDNIGGLAGWWTMDGQDIDWSGSSGQIKDNSGNANDGTTNGGMSNGQSAAHGRVGQALDFDGSDDYVDLGIPLGQGEDNLEKFTVSTWVNMDKWGNDWDYIAHRGVSSVISNSIYVLSASPGGNLAWSIDGDYGNGESSTSVNEIKDWRLLTGVFNGTEAILYLDGNVIHSYSADYPFNNDAQSNRLGLGNNPKNQSSSRYFNGLIDDARIYNHALTNTQITRLYNATRPSPINTSRTDRLTSGLVGFWSMNGQDVDLSDSTAEVKDVSGNGNDGDAKNGASPAIGKLGQGFGFDGEDGTYIDLNTPIFSTTDGSQPYTATAWIKTSQQRNGIITQYLGGDADRFIFGLNPTGSGDKAGKLEYWVGSNQALSTSRIDDNQWHHVAFTKDSSGSIQLYVDGHADGAGANTQDFSDTNTFIGAWRSYGGNMNGSIDNVRIYDRALSKQEVKQLYRLGQ